MGKWRPSEECLYVIPDIHGQLKQLELILSRILPLRKTDGVKDTLVFLGDYVDRGKDSHLVIDRMIELKKEYKDQVIALKGNHELMFMDGIAPAKTSDNYLFWMRLGGVDTLSGYLERAGKPMQNPYELIRARAKDFVPQEHKDFINSLPYSYETKDFIFVHGGMDPLLPIDKHDERVFAWDRDLYHFMCGIEGEPDLPWNKCIVTGHNCDVEEPLITPKFMMLDCSCHGKLNVLELNSMEGFVAKKGKKRLVRLEIE